LFEQNEASRKLAGQISRERLRGLDSSLQLSIFFRLSRLYAKSGDIDQVAEEKMQPKDVHCKNAKDNLDQNVAEQAVRTRH
jgi:hypothetical protein